MYLLSDLPIRHSMVLLGDQGRPPSRTTFQGPPPAPTRPRADVAADDPRGDDPRGDVAADVRAADAAADPPSPARLLACRPEYAH
jgi:hypothetical protein